MRPSDIRERRVNHRHIIRLAPSGLPKIKSSFDLLPLSTFQVSLWKQREKYTVSQLCSEHKSIVTAARPSLQNERMDALWAGGWYVSLKITKPQTNLLLFRNCVGHINRSSGTGDDKEMAGRCLFSPLCNLIARWPVIPASRASWTWPGLVRTWMGSCPCVHGQESATEPYSVRLVPPSIHHDKGWSTQPT